MTLKTLHFRENPSRRRRSRPVKRRKRARGPGRSRRGRRQRRGAWVLEAFKNGRPTGRYFHANPGKHWGARKNAMQFASSSEARRMARFVIEREPAGLDIRIRRA